MVEILSPHDYRAIEVAYKNFMRDPKHRETAKMLWGSHDDPHLHIRPKLDDEIL